MDDDILENDILERTSVSLLFEIVFILVDDEFFLQKREERKGENFS